MADAPILGGSKKVKLDASAFGARWSGQLVHDSVRAELNARRQGTASSKTRGEVSGGGAKPWRQKGTGRARVGEIRNPLWRGGGTVFGPQPRSYEYSIPKKVEKGAQRGAPKYMEWYGAFGLMVTLIWLYIEFLRLLAKLRDRR